MQITFDLSVETVKKLQSMPNIDDFIQQLINNALNNSVKVKKPLSKWALLVQEIENNPALQLNGYSEQMKEDMREVSDNFFFPSDE